MELIALEQGNTELVKYLSSYFDKSSVALVKVKLDALQKEQSDIKKLNELMNITVQQVEKQVLSA